MAAISSTYSQPSLAASAQVNQASLAAKEAERKQAPTDMPSIQSVRMEQNAAILSASMQVSIQAGNDSLGLLYRAAIDSLNEVLAPGQNIDVIGRAAQEQDNSPDATAQRILDFATGFFDAYAQQNPGKDMETLATDFVELVRGGFEKGFGEARNILEGLGVLGNNDIESGIMKTYDLVIKGFDDFLAAKLKPADEAGKVDEVAGAKEAPNQLPE